MTVSISSVPTPPSPAPAAATGSSSSSAPKAARKPTAKSAKKEAVKSATTKSKGPAAATAPASRATEPSARTAASKEGKVKKPKLVRDSFTIPKDEYAAVEILKQRCSALAQPVKKSELLRAGLKALSGMSDAALRKAVQAVPSIKTGRPKAAQDETVPTPSPTLKKAASRQ